jgi:hypothetical protein
VVAAGALLVQHGCARDPRLVYTRFDLPAFDAYVYVAMAEEPRVFTVAPWGYRVLTPALAHLAAGGDPTRVLRGFRLVNTVALAAAAVLLWWFARRLGFAPGAALAGTAIFALSPPVAELVRNPFLADAVGVALETGFLLAVESGVAWPGLALLAATGALAKESFLLVVPVAYFARRGRDGDARALFSAGAALVAAAGVTALLRLWWTPHLHTPALPATGFDTLREAAANVRALASRQAWAGVFLLAVVVAALLAARRVEGRALLARYGYAAAVTLVAPFFNPVVFSVGDMRRLVVHALPVLVPVLLAALPRTWATAPPAVAAARGRHVRIAAGVLAGAVLLSPLLLDRYRRADLQGPRDGPYVLAFCRETLRAARRLQRGEGVTLDPARRQFQWGVSDPGRLDQMRWFLRSGWGELAHYSTGPVTLRAPRGELVAPVLDARPLQLTLHLAAPPAAVGAVLVNGHRLGQWKADAAPQTWPVPAAVLFRGDNVVTLETAVGDYAEVVLGVFMIRNAAPPAPHEP